MDKPTSPAQEPPVAPIDSPSAAAPLVLAYLCHAHTPEAALAAPVNLPESRISSYAADDPQSLLCVWLI